VGLYILDDCPLAAGESSKAVLEGAPIRLRIGDDEAAPRMRFIPVKLDQAMDGVVERGSELMGELPNEKAGPDIGHIGLDPKDVAVGLDFEVTDDATLYVVAEGANFLVDRGQVFVCPIEPQLDAG
jgi:hypothetical protein